jgi:hypothetical protein
MHEVDGMTVMPFTERAAIEVAIEQQKAKRLLPIAERHQ